MTTWNDGIDPQRLAARAQVRAMTCPPINPVPVVDNEPAVAMYLWFHHQATEAERQAALGIVERSEPEARNRKKGKPI